jgi:hypothetical protein
VSFVVDMAVFNNKYDASNALSRVHWECRALDIRWDRKPVRGGRSL